LPSGFGLFCQPILRKIALMAVVIRSLALLCSIPLALPTGWCCMIGAPCCDQGQSKETGPDTSCPPARPKCCCDQSTDQTHNDRTPAPNPSAPAKSCSCEKAPTVAPEVARLVPDLFVAPLATPADCPLAKAGDQSELYRIFDPPRLPLHVSHCVWLC
jgi:hypothetical protein